MSTIDSFDKNHLLNLGTHLSYSKNWNIFTKEISNRIWKHHFFPFFNFFEYIYISKLRRIRDCHAPNSKFFLHSILFVFWAAHHMVSRFSSLLFSYFCFKPIALLFWWKIEKKWQRTIIGIGLKINRKSSD